MTGAIRFLAAFLVAVPLALAGETVPYVLDPEASWVRFQPKARFGSGAGEFRRFTAEAVIDEARLEGSLLSVDIDVGSIDTGIRKRDRHLLSKDFFDADAHPRAVLRVLSLRREGEGLFLGEGELTLRGRARGVSLPAALLENKDGRVVVEGETSIRRKDFGIDYDSRLNPIADEVRVSYRLALVRRAAPR